MMLPIRHAVNHVLILIKCLFLPAPEVTLLQEGCLVGLRFLLEDLQGVVIVQLEFDEGLGGVQRCFLLEGVHRGLKLGEHIVRGGGALDAFGGGRHTLALRGTKGALFDEVVGVLIPNDG